MHQHVNVQTFYMHECCWHGSKSVSRESLLTRKSTALSEAQDIQNTIPICRFDRILCRFCLIYYESGLKMSKNIGQTSNKYERSTL